MQFIVYSGKALTTDFTLISSDGTTPEVLNSGDTGTFSAQTSGPNPVSILKDIPIHILKKADDTLDLNSGTFELTLTAKQTACFKQYVGFQEDGFNAIGNHDGYLDFKLVSGDRQALITIAVKEIA